MTRCAEVRPLIYQELDRRLSPVERTALVTHLAVCPACREEESAARGVMGLVSGALGDPETADFPKGFDARFWAKARRAQDEKKPELVFFARSFFRPLWTGAIVAAVLVGAGWQWFRPERVSMEQATAGESDALVAAAVQVSRGEREHRRADDRARSLLQDVL